MIKCAHMTEHSLDPNELQLFIVNETKLILFSVDENEPFDLLFCGKVARPKLIFSFLIVLLLFLSIWFVFQI